MYIIVYEGNDYIMLLTRYEISIGGEPQDIGYLRGLTDVTDDIDTYEEILEIFTEKLTVPDQKYFKSTSTFYTASFFTPKGLKYLKNEIDELIDYIKYCGADIITVIKDIDLNDDDIIYTDDLQVLMTYKY